MAAPLRDDNGEETISNKIATKLGGLNQSSNKSRDPRQNR
jgi:hypothetical protein